MLLLLWVISTAIFWGLLTAWDHYFDAPDVEDSDVEELTIMAWHDDTPVDSKADIES